MTTFICLSIILPPLSLLGFQQNLLYAFPCVLSLCKSISGPNLWTRGQKLILSAMLSPILLQDFNQICCVPFPCAMFVQDDILIFSPAPGAWTRDKRSNWADLFCLFVLRFYSPVNPMGSC